MRSSLRFASGWTICGHVAVARDQCHGHPPSYESRARAIGSRCGQGNCRSRWPLLKSRIRSGNGRARLAPRAIGRRCVQLPRRRRARRQQLRRCSVPRARYVCEGPRGYCGFAISSWRSAADFVCPKCSNAAALSWSRLERPTAFYIEDFERALSPRTALLLRMHASNYRIEGFTHEPRAR